MSDRILRILQEVDIYDSVYTASNVKENYILEAQLLSDEVKYCENVKDVKKTINRIFQRHSGLDIDTNHPAVISAAERIFQLK